MPLLLTRMNLSKAQLLLVDDNAQSMEILISTLVGFGVKRMQTTASAAEARRIVSESSFDLMLVDHEMPVEDGLSFCRTVRVEQNRPNHTTPLVLMTTLPARDTVVQARDAGVNYVIAKPVSPIVLLERIEWIARSKRDFVTSDTYCGPDRRHHIVALPPGMEERRRDALRLIETPERALSQDDINALFE